MSTTRETKSISELIQMYDNDKLLLPEFQREFKWPLEKTETLFDSIFKDLFIGSLIFSKPKFDLSCKRLDLRERGSRSRKPVPFHIPKEEFDAKDIYTILDGQQRVTSIYRALVGPDTVYLIFKENSILLSQDFVDVNGKLLVGYDEYIDGFDSKAPANNSIYISLKDLYKSIDDRDADFLSEFIQPLFNDFELLDNQKTILEDFVLNLRKNFMSQILKQQTLISVQLLEMNIEKFCLYFERSNSQGLTLSFTDIIVAKVYTSFNLRKKIEQADAEHTYFNERLVDSTVRYINYLSNDSVTKKSILENLTGEDFIEHWTTTVKDLSDIQAHLLNDNWVFDVKNIPYKTMLLPILSFFQNLSYKDWSAASTEMIDVLKFWFFGSIYDIRYGGARHGSTNVVIKEDCDVMRELARGNFPEKEYWQKLRINFSFDEYKKIDSNKNAKFLALNYLMWHQIGFRNLNNNIKVSFQSNVDVHHVFPLKYLELKFGIDSDEFDFSDTMLNKIRINKIENIKIGKKAPKEYLRQILADNPNLRDSLESHLLGDVDDLIKGDYDDNYFGFLKSRYMAIEKVTKSLSEVHKNLLDGQNSDIWSEKIYSNIMKDRNE